MRPMKPFRPAAQARGRTQPPALAPAPIQYLYPPLRAEFVAATLLHLGLGDDDLRVDVARRLLRQAGYLDHPARVAGGPGAGRATRQPAEPA